MIETLTSKHMLAGLAELDVLLPKKAELIVGGGGAMLLAYDFPLSTTDIDAIPRGLSIEELKPHVEKVAKKLNYPVDWLNPWFSTFTHVLPPDYSSRLKTVFSGSKITALALGREDLLLMKCFAHRKKDIAHARVLIRQKADVDMVYKRIRDLALKKIPLCQEAEDFLDMVIDLEDV